jgi:hypothetical protein
LTGPGVYDSGMTDGPGGERDQAALIRALLAALLRASA